MKRVFISLPMSGVPYHTILENLQQAKSEYLRRFPESSEPIVFLDNLRVQEKPVFVKEGIEGVWYLGHALILMSRCDEVFFFGNWEEARGCRIEHSVCEAYGIPIVEV